MAWTNIDNLALGEFLRITFSDGVRNQISEDYRDWEYINRVRKGGQFGREHRFMFQTALGAHGVQYATPGLTNAAFPTAQQISVAEYTAKMNEIRSTVEIEYNLWDKARKDPDKYAEPLMLEIQSKATAAKRRLAADLYGDGLGVLGRVASVASWTADGAIVITLRNNDSDQGGVGQFEYGDLIEFVGPADGLANLPDEDAGTFAYMRVDAKNRAANTITCSTFDSSGDAVTLSGAGTVEAGDYLVRYGQPTNPGISGESTDYNLKTEVFAGLESLAATDGRVVHGITMSGAAAGSAYDCSAEAIDVSHIQAAMSEVKVRVGAGAYSWPAMVMAPEANNALVESREVDRRFTTVADNKRGVNKFVYVHESDNLEVISSEFVPKKRIWILPQEKAGNGVLEFHGSDFESVRPGGAGSEFFLKPSGDGGHLAMINSYMQAYICLICKHPAAVLKLHNFTS